MIDFGTFWSCGLACGSVSWTSGFIWCFEIVLVGRSVPEFTLLYARVLFTQISHIEQPYVKVMICKAHLVRPLPREGHAEAGGAARQLVKTC
jgi:hypothetical protein